MDSIRGLEAFIPEGTILILSYYSNTWLLLSLYIDSL
jgi:hypothetical protein